MALNSMLSNMLSKGVPDFVYNFPSTYPTEDVFVDFSKIDYTDIYHFVSLNDADCVPE